MDIISYEAKVVCMIFYSKNMPTSPRTLTDPSGKQTPAINQCENYTLQDWMLGFDTTKP